jgi:adenylosuccinate lyase
MPHKRNPWKSEQLAGLARVLRANVLPGLEDVTLWHERDISNSSVERIVLPDSLQLAYYAIVRFRAIVEGLVVHPERMRENLASSYGLVFSQTVLLQLVESGLSRDDAYRMVQRDATKSWEERRSFLDVLREDKDVTAALGDERLAACFDLDRALANAGRAVDALDSPGRIGPGGTGAVV